jgi:hypothetical protein
MAAPHPKGDEVGVINNPHRKTLADISKDFLTTEQVSDYLLDKYGIKMSPSTLSLRRMFGKSPAYIKVASAVVYTRSDVDMFARSVGLSTKGFQEPKREPRMTAQEKARRAGK